jgi:hypothetical protein
MVQIVVNLTLVLVRSPVVGDIKIKSHRVQANKISEGIEYTLLCCEEYWNYVYSSWDN